MKPLIPKPAVLDLLCGEICRSRGICENPKCRKMAGLQWAHIISRRYKQVRWDIDNCFCLCNGCHFYFTNRPIEWDMFVVSMIGEKKYEELKRRALDYKKIDYALIHYNLKKAKREHYNGLHLPIDK